MRVERKHEVGIVQVRRPRYADGAGGTAQLGDRTRVRRWQRADDPDLRVDHQVRCGHPRQQRDLLVPTLDRKRLAVAQGPTVVVGLDLLIRQRQADTAAFALVLLAQLTDLPKQHEDLVGRAVVDGALYAVVVVLRPAPHPRPEHLHPRTVAGLVQVDLPHQRWTYLVRQQTGSCLGQLRWVQGYAVGRRVQRLPAQVRLDIDGVTWAHERGHVGDRVVHPEAFVAAFEMHGLVQVTRAGRVDGHERQIRAVPIRKDDRCGGPPCLRDHVVGERRADRELGLDGVDVLCKHLHRRGLDPQLST